MSNYHMVEARVFFDLRQRVGGELAMSRVLPEPTVESFDLTVILSALAEPGRRALMTALYRRAARDEPIDCMVIAQEVDLGVSAPTLSHHYRVLREAGLVRTTAVGRSRVVTVRITDVESRFPGLLDATLTAT
ncbi:ArsR/SmtB family transcription factor [Tsukamurella sp. DT100]|uniref:ArsR/SmtB family transcription factor n=1 Tax=Tsukamurella sp. DT100 TaxID=3393415 RepID=UPI003CF91D16